MPGNERVDGRGIARRVRLELIDREVGRQCRADGGIRHGLV
jgi:hypothetical protein